jgi:thiamine biosynthesis lipoprotein
MRYLKLLIVVAVIAAIVVVIALGRDRRREAIFYPFGGIPFKVVVYDRSTAEFEADMTAVKGRVAELERAFNRYKPGSELARINADAQVAPVKVDADMAQVLAASAKWHKLSGGAFDPTVGPLIELWQQAGEVGEMPSDERVAVADGRVGFDEIIFSHDGRIMFAREGMMLDFGAIAKGFMSDEVARLLTSRDVGRGIVDAGGNAVAFGDGLFTFGMADPRYAGRDELLATVKVGDGAVITSGNYERYVTIGQKRYSHILDPRTGKPVSGELVAVTVIGGAGVDADAMATTLMVLGREKGMELARQVPEVSAVFVEFKDGDWNVWAPTSLQRDLAFADMWAEKVHWYDPVANSVN